ncbi:MAG: methionine--tRNA ligase [Thermoplasmata archaeon]
MSRILVAVSWPYANGALHIGHLASTYLPADIFARYHRLRGNEVLMISGSDMHGTPTLIAAEKEGVAPQVVAERFDAINRQALRDLAITFDLFTSTETPVHYRTAQEIFLKLLENGFVARRTEDNPYCPKDERFLADRYLVGECPHCHFPSARGDECDHCGRILEARQLIGPKCALCGTPVEFRPSEHFFLLLDKLAPDLERYLEDKSYWRPNVLGVTREFLKRGLHATAITRDIDWGVPIPLDGYPSKRLYVWFEALAGYLSAAKEWAIRAGRPTAWERYWGEGEPVRQYYFVGKDNIFFHSLVWPGILVGARGFPLPYDIPANEWLQIEGKKISKSRGSEVSAFIPSLLTQYRPDMIRFYAALLAPQNHDTEFQWSEFDQVCEDVLSNQYGNLAQRLLVLARERYEGRVPSPPDGWSPDGAGSIGERVRAAHERISQEIEKVHLKEALDLVLAEVRDENRRFHEARPWSAGEDERRRSLYEGLWHLKAIAMWSAPFLPFSSAEVLRMLGYTEPAQSGSWEQALEPVASGQPLGEIRPLFPRRERERATPAAPAKLTLGLAGPVPLGLQSAVIRSAEDHPSADKLYVLRLDVGGPTPRTVVAGLRPYYRADELRERRVVLLSNLEPRTIRRVTSQGMILAADSGDRVLLLAPPEDCPPGTLRDGSPDPLPNIRYEDFERAPLLVGRVTGVDGPLSVQVDVGGRTVVAKGHPPLHELVLVQLDSPDAASGEVVTMNGGRPVRPDPSSAPGMRVR